MAKSKPKKIKQETKQPNHTKKPKYILLEEQNPYPVIEHKQKNIFFPSEEEDEDAYQLIKNTLESVRGTDEWQVISFMERIDEIPKKQRQTHITHIWDLLKTLKKNRALEMLKDDIKLQNISKIATLQPYFVRELKDWKRKSHNPEKQFLSLLQHLLVKYKVPNCFLNAWWDYDYPHLAIKTSKMLSIKWFIALTNGASAKNLDNFPVKMTPKMAHYFMNSPDYLDVSDAIRYAQVMAYGGDEYLAWYINTSYLGRNNFKHEEFWETVIAFFGRTPMFDAENIPNLVDYLEAQRRATRGNFSMKGRTINALLRQSEEWHAQMTQRRSIPSNNKYAVWEKCSINSFIKEEGIIQNGNYKKYIIRELLSSSDLQKEGNVMNHCVSSYIQRCEKRQTAIFTLEQYSFLDDLLEKMVTIEINLLNNQLTQAKGKYNRQTTEKERNIIQHWLIENDIKKSKWIDW